MKTQISIFRLFAIALLSIAAGTLLFAAIGVGTPEKEGLEEDEAKGDRPDEALRFRRLQLQDEKGKIPVDGLQKAREQIAVMKAAQQRAAKAAGKVNGLEVAGIDPGAWIWLGPGNIGGRIRSIVIDPVNANNMWVGSVAGGLWRSTDAGVAWQPVNEFVGNLAVSTIVINPTNSSIMYAGTGESFASALGATEGQDIANNGLRGDGVFKSTDGGVTWNQLLRTRSSDPSVCGAGAGVNCPWSYVNRLAMSPNGSTILAATISGIERSIDGGATWNPAPTFAANIQDVDFNPADSNKAIAARPGATKYSIDGGATWISATFTPALNPIVSPGPSLRVELAYAPSNPLIVYASVDQSTGVVPNQTQGDVYKSTDGGQTYTRLNTILPGNTFLGGQGGYGNIIWVNPLDPNFVIVGGINMYRSTDGGINWIAIASGQFGSAHSDHHMIVASSAFNNTTNKQVYFTNDGGIYRADDVSTVSLTPAPNGWTKLNNNLGITQFYGAAGNADGVIVGGTQDNGTQRYSGDPQAWTQMFGGDGGFSAADPTDVNYFYGEYTTLGILRSTDGGASSSYIYCNPVPPSANGGVCTGTGITDAFNGANFIAPFTLDPSDSNTMLAGGMSLWRSSDVKAAGLPTWTAIKPPASNGLIPPSNVPISAIVVSANNSDLIVVGHNDGQIYLTFNGTNTPPTWIKISNVGGGTPARFVTRVVIDETRSPNWIYATFGGFAGDNIYRTSDLGSTWSDVSGAGATSLPGVPVRSLLLHPIHPEFLYVGTEVGIFASEDGGATWKLPTDGPANVSVDELFWNKGDLVAATHGRGLYKTFTAVYNLPICIFGAPCPCAGYWDCPCHWNNNQIPDANDEVIIQCPTTVRSSAQAKSIRVNNRLILDGDLRVLEDVDNYGNISSSPGTQGGFIFACRNLSNSRPAHTVTDAGIISIPHAIIAAGDVLNGGIISLGTSLLQATSLRTAPDSTLTVTNLYVRGNVDNDGSINGNSIQFIGTPGPHIFSGSGLWQTGSFGIPNGHTVTLGSNVTLDISSFSNNGTLDVSNKTLIFRGVSFAGANTFAGTGLIRMAPSSGSAIFAYAGQNFTPAVTIASGTIDDRSNGTISGPLTIDAGATFSLDYSNLAVNNDVTVNGTITKTPGSGSVQFNFNGTTFENNGSVTGVDYFTFNTSGAPLSQNLTGTGLWAPTNIFVGGGTSSPSTLKLFNDVTFGVNQFQTLTGALNVDNHTLTLTGATFIVGATVSGTGVVKMQPTSGFSTIRSFQNSASQFTPELKIASGTVTANTTTSSLTLNGLLTVDVGTTFSLNGYGVGATGDVMINGTLNAAGGSPSFGFQGSNFTNNGGISGVYVYFGPSYLDPPLAQGLAGTGSWAGTPFLYINNLSITTLQNNVTFDGAQLYLEGRVNTGAFTLSLPCTTVWQGAGDVVGNVRRTNLAACPGTPIAFGSPFTTIAFTSGTAPTEVTVNVALGPPAGFANAVQRSYLITPSGGSGYTATLRLHYLDSELNGNDEATLQMYRNDGTIWNAQGATSRNTTNNWVEYSGVTQFSPWTLSSLTPPPPSTPTPTPSPTPSPTASPTATPTVSIAGNISYCSNPVPGPVPNVTLTLTGDASNSTLSDSSGHYQLSSLASGGSYIVTPTKTALTPASAGINTIDAIAVQRHFLVFGIPLSGCKLTAADVNGDTTVNTVDAIAIQRFFLGYQTSTANVGKYQFSPASRAYPGIVSNQTAQDYNTLVFGDVASTFVELPEDPSQSAESDSD